MASAYIVFTSRPLDDAAWHIPVTVNHPSAHRRKTRDSRPNGCLHNHLALPTAFSFAFALPCKLQIQREIMLVHSCLPTFASSHIIVSNISYIYDVPKAVLFAEQPDQLKNGLLPIICDMELDDLSVICTRLTTVSDYIVLTSRALDDAA